MVVESVIARFDDVKIGLTLHFEPDRRARRIGERIDVWFELLLNKSRQLAELAISCRGESNRIRYGLDSDFALHSLPWNGTLLLSLFQGTPGVPEIALILDHTGGIGVRQNLAGTAVLEL